MRCDIVIVSCRRDLHWLSFCLRLLDKNWREPNSQIIVRLDEDCREIVKDWKVSARYYFVKPWPDGYMYQMYQKMISDDYSDADMIMMVDSDLMMVRPVALQDFLVDGKPVIETLDWNMHRIGEGVWRKPVSRVMGMDLDKDYMVKVPNLYWRDTLQKTRLHIIRATGQGFLDAVYSDRPFKSTLFLTHPHTFADFECLNLYAAKFQSDRYLVRPQEHNPNNPFNLFWSHGDFSEEVQKQLEEKLRE
jgi:hypothetical protein